MNEYSYTIIAIILFLLFLFFKKKKITSSAPSGPIGNDEDEITPNLHQIPKNNFLNKPYTPRDKIIPQIHDEIIKDYDTIHIPDYHPPTNENNYLNNI